MFLLRKFRFRALGLCIIVLVTVAIVTWMLPTGSHGDEEETVAKQQSTLASDAASTLVRVAINSNQLSQRLMLINSSAVRERQLQRQRHLASACERLGLGRQAPNFKTSDMYINDTLRYIYCVVNKVACTSWKRVLLMASGEMAVDRAEKLSMTFVHNWRITDRYFPRIRTFAFQQVQQRLPTHFKYMFVRHPLERLVSTYRDKFTKPAYYYPQRFGRKIVRTVRGANASEQSLRRGNDVRFQEMVQYLLDPQTTRAQNHLLSDNHWKQQHLLCHPCYMHFDFIGHYETLQEDAHAVLQVLGIADRVRFPDTDPDNRWKKKTTEVAARILSEISADELRRVKELYEYDFELFGYDPNML